MPIYNQPHQQFIAQIRNSGVLIKPPRRLYYAGEKITAVVNSLDGRSPQETCFTIAHSPGSGFAGQVYCAQPEGGTDLVAIKVLRPASIWKERFRDALFRLSFQAAFAPRLTEEAVRAGLIWQTLLRIGAGIEWGTPTAVVQPLGYYWDEELRSFAEIHQWIDGRSSRYSADEQLVGRLFDHAATMPNGEMSRQRHFMSRMTRLCYQMGAVGLARQYEWYTFVSQANVLHCQTLEPGQSEFVAVDFRPGLAVPFFLPLSPHHLHIIIQGLRRGILRHFDEVDMARLDRYTADHAGQFEPVQTLIEQLQEDEARYRDGLPDLWQHPTHLRERRVKTAVIATWHQSGLIADDQLPQLTERTTLFYLYFLLDHMPVLGHFLLRLWGNHRYRQHWQRMIRERDYRKEVTAVIRDRDLVEWLQTGRVTTAVIPKLARSMPRYWRDKLILSWLPAPIQRLLTSRAALLEWLYSRLLFPLRLLFQPEQRQKWLHHIISVQVKNGVVSRSDETRFREQIYEPLMHGYLRDLGLTAGLDIFSKTLSLLLAYYGVVQGNFLPFLVVSFG
ncbi:MAG: hypothetical protein WAM60_20075, partial [Candidatus Promineifilaceae bacterium]